MGSSSDVSSKGSAVLLDIENLTISARKDEKSQQLSRSEVLRSLVAKVMETAKEAGSIISAKAALSVPAPETDPTKPSKHNKGRSRKEASRTAVYLTDMGFNVTLVPQGPDRADWVLNEDGKALVSDPKINTVILGTGDGGEPFFGLVQMLLAVGKAVHVVSYDKPPQSLKSSGATFSSLAQSLHMESSDKEENAPSVCATTPSTEDSLKTPIVAPTEEKTPPPEKPKKHYTRVIRSLKDKTLDIGDQHYKRFATAIWALEANFRKYKNSPINPGKLIDAIQEDLKKNGLDATEAKEIFHAIIDFTDLLKVHTTYSLNESSLLLQMVKLV